MEYLLKEAAVLTLFYGVYKIFLERETFFQSIRAYLLLGLVSSLLLPGLKIKEYVLVEDYLDSIQILYEGLKKLRDLHLTAKKKALS